MRSGWVDCELEEIATVERGKFSARPRNDPRYYGGNIPFIQTGDIVGSLGRINSWRQSLNNDGLAVSKLFPKGTIFITIAANIGDVAICEFDTACPDSIVAIRPKRNIDRDWLAYVLSTCQRNLRALATQNAQKNINLQILKPLTLAVPPLSEQRSIAEILHSWDQAIAKTTLLIEKKQRTLEHLARALFSGHQRIPARRINWRNVALTDVTTELTARNGGRLTSQHVMGVNKIHGLIPMKDHVRAADLSRYKIVAPNAFAYNPMRLNIGSLAMNCRGHEVLVSPDYVVFSANERDLEAGFFDHIRRVELWIRFVEAAGSGGVRIRIYYDDLGDFQFDLPPIEEQRRITAILDTGRRELSLLEAEKVAFEKQKRGLMQKLLTGAWRVTNLEPSARTPTHG